MAGYKWHILFGAVFAGVVGYIINKFNLLTLPAGYAILSVPIIFIYSMLPDIDIASSRIRKTVTTTGILFLLAAILSEIKWLSASIALVLLTFQFVKHRRFTHTIPAAVLFSMPWIMISYMIALSAFLGYLSHLILDGKIKLA